MIALPSSRRENTSASVLYACVLARPKLFVQGSAGKTSRLSEAYIPQRWTRVLRRGIPCARQITADPTNGSLEKQSPKTFLRSSVFHSPSPVIFMIGTDDLKS